MDKNIYNNPLTDRYCSVEMSEIFSPLHMAKVWRQLWIVLAKGQRELGLNISQEQIDDLVAYSNDIDFDVIEYHEQRIRHDVMSHLYAYGEQAKLAKPILHLGATSNYIKDNTDLILFKQALQLVKAKLLLVIKQLSKFALLYKDLPTLGWTHLQPAQPTTVGKRATLWLFDFVQDFDKLEYLLSTLRLRGLKGTTGTQASFLDLFDGQASKTTELEDKIASHFDFKGVYAITGQSYSRKVDYDILSMLSSIAQSASKFGTDMRLLASIKEIEEPFEQEQVGSSAMAYKRNPMRCERICGLSRFVISLPINTSITASTQWLERTLDDSANRRIVMSQGFLAIDSILNLMIDVTNNIVVYPNVVQSNLQKELPFMTIENILMNAVKLGGDRQQLHEAIRQHSMQVSKNIKQSIERENISCENSNDLIRRLKQDKLFSKVNFDEILQPCLYIGLASHQTQDYIENVVNPILDINKKLIDDVVLHKISV